MEDVKNKVEAVLFTTGRSLSLQELGQLTGIGSVGIIKGALESLKNEYLTRSSSLEIFNENDKWRLNLKREYLYITEKLLTDAELDKPTQETLAIIAFKQPILQSDIIKIRGNSAYDHIKKLKEENFIFSEKSGRTRILKLAPKFYDYFDVVEDALKSKLHNIPNIIGVQKSIENKNTMENKTP
ncbi:SMC-Scp complex subunit ScpB, partial [Candidatus Woesearchaeota archaeon]|nr:SMC-Scp complex subunit ScpB [Candidatus Woesearchaeota archaeon]